MSMVLSRFSLKVQIGSLVALAGVILGLSLTVLWVGQSFSNAAGDKAAVEGVIGERGAALNIALLEARRNEKDFLLRKDAVYVTAHAESMAAATSALDAMAAAMDASDPRHSQAEIVRKGIGVYMGKFAKTAEEQTRVGLDETKGLMGALRGSVHEVETALKAYDEPRLSVLMLMMRRHEKDFLARMDPKYVGELDKRVAEFDKAIQASSIPADQRAAILERMAAYQRDFKAAAEASLTATAAAKDLSDAYASIRPSILDLLKSARESMATARAEAARIDHLINRIMTLVVLAGFAGMVVIGTVIARSIYRPIAAMTGVMEALAQGNHGIAVPDQQRGDEVGAMARSVQVFKEAILEAERLRHAQEEDRKRAEREKVAALQGMAETVERETRAAVDQIAELTRRMADNAGGMAASAAAVGENCHSVAAAASQALANAQTVAAAAEQLSASIREISSQVGTATQVTGNAVSASTRAQTTIAQLSQTVGRIGEVANLINDIASQTNLLALNATIEAARAGEAGKGFAVVANEVKHLANQTARATEEISRQITDIQSTTQDAVHAVGEITNAIGEVEGVSSAVAAAIEEQGAATQEIARNVAQTSDAAQEVAARITVVSDEARSTGERATQVGSVSAEVASGVDRLRDVLIRVVRTATKEVNRRQSPRYRVERDCTVTAQGHTVTGLMVDCSEGGFAAKGDFSHLAEGAAVEIAISGAVSHLHAVIRSLGDSRVHAQFDVDEAKSPGWRQDFATLIRGLAPLEQAA